VRRSDVENVFEAIVKRDTACGERSSVRVKTRSDLTLVQGQPLEPSSEQKSHLHQSCT
jgi:hypothetical protein